MNRSRRLSRPGDKGDSLPAGTWLIIFLVADDQRDRQSRIDGRMMVQPMVGQRHLRFVRRSADVGVVGSARLASLAADPSTLPTYASH